MFLIDAQLKEQHIKVVRKKKYGIELAMTNNIGSMKNELLLQLNA